MNVYFRVEGFGLKGTNMRVQITTNFRILCGMVLYFEDFI